MLIAALLTFGQVLTAREYEVYGPQGGLAMEVTLPKDFDPLTQKCPMLILLNLSSASE